MTQDFRDAVAALHRQLDAWAATVEGVAAEADDPATAVSDPRLEAAEEAFNRALSDFHGAAGPVLGLPEMVDLSDGEDGTGDVDDDTDHRLLLEFRVVAPEGRAGSLEEAHRILDDAAFATVERLEEAGFTVPSFSSVQTWPGAEEDE